MIQTLWLKKIWKGRSKGISSVIGTVFLILVVFAISTNVFLWTISQSSIYNQAVKDTNQKNADKLNENVVATQGNYTVVSVNKVKVEAKLTNAGSVAAQIINLWVFDTSKQTYGFNSSIVSMSGSNLNPGQVLNFTGTNGIIVTVSGAGSLDSYNAWFVTARGNTVPLTKSQSTTVINSQISQGIGALTMDFQNFNYYKVYSKSEQYYFNFSSAKSGYNVAKSDAPLGFSINLTNLDIKGRNIILDLNSELFSIFPSTGGNYKAVTWYIVNVNPTTGLIQTTFTNIPLNYTKPTFVYFASKSPIQGSFSTVNSNDMFTGTCPVNLALTGTIGGSPFGQNLPFVSILVS